MFLRRNKKNNAYPFKPQFFYIKVGFKGAKIIKACFRDDFTELYIGDIYALDCRVRDQAFIRSKTMDIKYCNIL